MGEVVKASGRLCATELQLRALEIPSLSDEQIEVFCQTYLITVDPRRSAREAGIGGTSAGHKMLRHPAVRNRMNELYEERAAGAALTENYVRENLRDSVEMAMGRMPRVETVERTKKTKNGDVVVTEMREYISTDLAQAKQSLELLAKHLGMLKDNVDVSVRPHEEWVKMLNDGAGPIGPAESSLDALEAEFEEVERGRG